MEFITILFRTLFFYFFIVLIYRIMGKREVGQLGIIDLIVSLLIAELVVISIENFEDTIWHSLIPIIALTILQVSLAFMSLKMPKLRSFLDGNPSVIIKEGKINYKEMVKQKYNIEDLLVQIREKGYRTIEEIEYAILENNGTLSVFKNESKKTPFPMPLILDGKVELSTLKNLNKTEDWIKKIIKDKGIEINNIFFAFYKDNNIFIIKNSDLL